MNKILLTALIMLLVFIRLYSEENNYTEKDILISCKTLTRLAGKAALKDEYANLIALHASYQILREKIKDKSLISEQDYFFKQLSTLNEGNIPKFIFSFAEPPQIMRGGGGWTQKELNEYLLFKANGYKVPKPRIPGWSHKETEQFMELAMRGLTFNSLSVVKDNNFPILKENSSIYIPETSGTHIKLESITPKVSEEKFKLIDTELESLMNRMQHLIDERKLEKFRLQQGIDNP